MKYIKLVENLNYAKKSYQLTGNWWLRPFYTIRELLFLLNNHYDVWESNKTTIHELNRMVADLYREKKTPEETVQKLRLCEDDWKRNSVLVNDFQHANDELRSENVRLKNKGKKK